MIKYVGVDDLNIDLFESQYVVKNGMSYNSYIIQDSKICVMDTVDFQYANEWLENIKKVLNKKVPDYLVLHHMEPDHSGSVKAFLAKYPSTTVVGNAKTFVMLNQFFPNINIQNKLVVKDNDKLELGKNDTLTFIFAPMVHWPEVMMSVDNGLLFSADAFGKFGALKFEDNWDDEARRYYYGIVGKYGAQVQALIKKLTPFNVRAILPLHGPIIKDTLPHVIDLYSKWSQYQPEDNGVCIFYTSVYGNTKKACMRLYDQLQMKNSEIIDLARFDMSEAVAKAFYYKKIVLASPTYNGDLFPPMKQFLDALKERNYQNRTIAFIENGSWAPITAKKMKEFAEANFKNITFIEPQITLKGAMTADNVTQINFLVGSLKK
jgi:flavorubredoxin